MAEIKTAVLNELDENPPVQNADGERYLNIPEGKRFRTKTRFLNRRCEMQPPRTNKDNGESNLVWEPRVKR